MKIHSVAIAGTMGLPAKYGGFETLVENLAKYHEIKQLPDSLTVYCSARHYPNREQHYGTAKLRYVPLDANGAQSILYDGWSLISAALTKQDVILLLGVSGAIFIPIIRLLCSSRIITNIDGIEWRRDKWSGLSKWFLHFSEKVAVRFSHEIITDNVAISKYVNKEYHHPSHVIAYGGDHTINAEAISYSGANFGSEYAFCVCRIEPENNIKMILDAYSKTDRTSIVIVGNWDNSEYGRRLRRKYSTYSHIHLLGPIYNLGTLKSLRQNASLYIHGHSAGGTNPSLVEAMQFGIPIIAYDCDFNRFTTEDKALYFKDSAQLIDLLLKTGVDKLNSVASEMLEIAQRRYTWNRVASQYWALLSTK